MGSKEKVEIIFTIQEEKDFWGAMEKYPKKCDANLISLKYLPLSEKEMLIKSFVEELMKMNYIIIYERKPLAEPKTTTITEIETEIKQTT